MSMLDGIQERAAKPEQDMGFFKKHFYDGFDNAPLKLKDSFQQAVTAVSFSAALLAISYNHLFVNQMGTKVLDTPYLGAVAAIGGVLGAVGYNFIKDPDPEDLKAWDERDKSKISFAFPAAMAITSLSTGVLIGGMSLNNSFMLAGGVGTALMAKPLTQAAGMVTRGAVEMYEKAKDFLPAPTMG